jgi:hypothetical protein
VSLAACQRMTCLQAGLAGWLVDVGHAGLCQWWQHDASSAAVLVTPLITFPGVTWLFLRLFSSLLPSSDCLLLPACSVTLTPDGNLTIGIAPGASEGRVNFTALVQWPQNLQPIPPADVLAPGQQGSIADSPQVTQVRRMSSEGQQYRRSQQCWSCSTQACRTCNLNQPSSRWCRLPDADSCCSVSVLTAAVFPDLPRQAAGGQREPPASSMPCFACLAASVTNHIS